MASKKKKATRNGAGKFGAKADFIRSMSPDVSARDVVAEAAKKGIKLTAAHVYNVRRAATGGKAKASAGRTRTAAASTSASGELDGRLRKVIAEIGLNRARQVFAEVESAFAGQ